MAGGWGAPRPSLIGSWGNRANSRTATCPNAAGMLTEPPSIVQDSGSAPGLKRPSRLEEARSAGQSSSRKNTRLPRRSPSGWPDCPHGRPLPLICPQAMHHTRPPQARPRGTTGDIRLPAPGKGLTVAGCLGRPLSGQGLKRGPQQLPKALGPRCASKDSRNSQPPPWCRWPRPHSLTPAANVH